MFSEAVFHVGTGSWDFAMQIVYVYDKAQVSSAFGLTVYQYLLRALASESHECIN